MISPNQELRAAVYSRLTSGSRRIKWNVYVDPPQDQDAGLPYIQLGEIFRRNNSAKGIPGFTLTLRVHFWSDEETYKEIEDMESDLMNSITFSNSQTYVPLTMPNFGIGWCGPSDSSEASTPDEKHLISDFEFIISS